MTSGEKYYRSAIEPEQLRRLHQRSNLAATLRVAGHLGSLIFTGGLFFFCTERDWWIPAVLVMLLHGTIFSFLGYAGASHEFSHNSVFIHKAPNQLFFRFFSFLVWGNHNYFFRSHAVHHRHTLDPEVDTEVPTTKCIAIFNVLVTSTFDVARLFRTIRMQWLNAKGVVPGKAATSLFPTDNPELRHQLANTARIILGVHSILAITFVAAGYWQLIPLFSLAAFIGNGLPNFLASAQHCGMKAATLDYRESSRTVLLNPVISFFYWNMNYHVEHHMYPGVPCYHLPKLRQLIEADIGPATIGIRGVLKEMRNDHRNRGVGDCSIQSS